MSASGVRSPDLASHGSVGSDEEVLKHLCNPVLVVRTGNASRGGLRVGMAVGHRPGPAGIEATVEPQMPAEAAERYPHKQAVMNKYLGILMFKLRPLPGQPSR